MPVGLWQKCDSGYGMAVSSMVSVHCKSSCLPDLLDKQFTVKKDTRKLEKLMRVTLTSHLRKTCYKKRLPLMETVAVYRLL